MESCVHIPVMLAEVLSGLNLRSGGRYFDGTVGGGGHAEAILDRSGPSGWLYGCDRDPAAVVVATERLARFTGRFEIRTLNYARVGEWLEPGICDAALLDLGVSSVQLDQPGRGFSFQADGPLDMRMDVSQAQTAADILGEASVAELARIFWEYGGETEARRLAKAIDWARRQNRIESTGQLARLIERVKPRGPRRTHPATQVFQALRIVVNDELGALSEGLEAVWVCLRVGARLAVITFHSLEDRLVKEFGRRRARPYQVPGGIDVPELRQPRIPDLRWITRKPVCPGIEEMKRNPRARSAQLRLFEKIHATKS